MKITDYALIFIGITIPFILIAYINIAFTIRTYQQEMYYQKVIDAAVEDTLSEMKRIESNEVTNDYGYSGLVDNKISINPQVAVSTFFDSIYNSLNIYSDKATQSLVQLYVPVLAIIDYNGVYISSVEEVKKVVKIDGIDTEVDTTEHILKPKRYFSYEYGYINGDFCTIKDGKWQKVTLNNDVTEYSPVSGTPVYYHNIEFTTDDRVFHTYTNSSTYENKEFYLRDSSNNGDNRDDPTKEDDHLFKGISASLNKEYVLDILEAERKRILVEVVTEELTYAANKNNEYAHEKGISYNFAFTVDSTDEMYNYVQNVGVLALVQGIKVGNKYFNYKAYNVSDLVLTHKYYLTAGSTKFASNLYHKTTDCLEYSEGTLEKIVYTKQEAASFGYYPCPLCNP